MLMLMHRNYEKFIVAHSHPHWRYMYLQTPPQPNNTVVSFTFKFVCIWFRLSTLALNVSPEIQISLRQSQGSVLWVYSRCESNKAIILISFGISSNIDTSEECVIIVKAGVSCVVMKATPAYNWLTTCFTSPSSFRWYSSALWVPLISRWDD